MGPPWIIFGWIKRWRIERKCPEGSADVTQNSQTIAGPSDVGPEVLFMLTCHATGTEEEPIRTALCSRRRPNQLRNKFCLPQPVVLLTLVPTGTLVVSDTPRPSSPVLHAGSSGMYSWSPGGHGPVWPQCSGPSVMKSGLCRPDVNRCGLT